MSGQSNRLLAFHGWSKQRRATLTGHQSRSASMGTRASSTRKSISTALLISCAIIALWNQWSWRQNDMLMQSAFLPITDVIGDTQMIAASVEVKAEQEAEPEPPRTPEPEPQLESSAKAESEPQVESQSKAEPEPAESEAQPQTEPQHTADLEARPKPQPKPESQPESQPQAEPQSVADLELSDGFPKRNVRIAFVGDSLTRYTYLTLVYYLHFNAWPQHNDRFVTIGPRSSRNLWHGLFNYTSTLMQPYETCDCYRNWQKVFRQRRHVENRYYIDDARNISIIYIGKFGNRSVHGHYDPIEIQQKPMPINFVSRRFKWDYPEWPQFIRNYIRPFNLDYFIFNQGQWPHHDLHDVNVVEGIRSALKEINVTSIYRTTTARLDGQEYGGHDAHICSVMDQCLNVSWTEELPKDNRTFIDFVHLHANANNRMTRQLLELLSEIRMHPKKEEGIR